MKASRIGKIVLGLAFVPLGLIVATRGEGSAALVVGFVFAAFGVLTIFGSTRGGSGGVDAGIDGTEAIAVTAAGVVTAAVAAAISAPLAASAAPRGEIQVRC